MDILVEDPALQSVLNDHGDLNGIDNVALDFDDLEQFINEDSVCLPEDSISAVAFNDLHNGIHHNQHMGSGFRINNALRPCMPQTTVPQHMPTMSQQQTNMYNPPTTVNGMCYPDSNGQLVHTTLPDSPPDSEPYSPPEGHTQQDNSKYNLSSTPSSMHPHMYPTHHRPPGLPPPPKTLMQGYEPPSLNHTLVPSSQPPHTSSMPLASSTNSMNPQILSPQHLSPNMTSHQNKKRKYVDSPNSTVTGSIFNGRNGILPNIKQEPPGGSYPNYMADCEDDYSNYDPDSSNSGFIDSTYQVIKWQPFQVQKWATLTDANIKDLPAPTYRVDADKGFNFSIPDDSFVCQKKNHFQVTCHIGMSGDPKYIRTPDGVKKIESYYLHFNGIKMESQTQTIQIEQSQSDRSKKAFHPVRVEPLPDQMTKLTVGRLHFSETTSNNMRKKGRPNPDQRYFLLVVALHAHSGENSYMISAMSSEKIIVRASNPGQFDSDVDVTWQKGHTPESVYHTGRVGVNTDHPDEAVTVHGNVKLTGHILQTSDIRAKEKLEEVNPKDQLKKVSQLKIYNYHYSDDYADHVGLPDDERKDTGVIAQELQDVLPDAVKETGDVVLPGGRAIQNMLVVNKERIFMENVGAVKELCKLTDNLENRIDELEKMNSKLSKLKRFDSIKSSASTKSTISTSTINSTSPKKSHSRHHIRSKSSPPPRNQGWCSNRFIQITIIILICIMAFCLIAITVLYILERQKEAAGHHTTHTHHIIQGPGPTIPGQPIQNQSFPQPASAGPDSSTSPSLQPVSSTSSSSSSTMATTSNPCKTDNLIDPSMRPVLPPIPECSGFDCEPFCCDTFSDEGKVPDWFSTFGREQIIPMASSQPGLDVAAQSTSRKSSPATPRYDIIDNSSGRHNDTRVQPGVTVSNEIPEVVLKPKQNWPRGDSGTSNGSNSVYSGQYSYRRRRKKRFLGDGPEKLDENSAFTATMVIRGSQNFTIGPCNYDRDRSHGANNHTYRIPYNRSTTSDAKITLEFLLNNSSMEVHMCHNRTQHDCTNSATHEPLPSISQQWTLELGRYIRSMYRFRITRPGNADVCSQPANESGGVFTEYNLMFNRFC